MAVLASKKVKVFAENVHRITNLLHTSHNERMVIDDSGMSRLNNFVSNF